MKLTNIIKRLKTLMKDGSLDGTKMAYKKLEEVEKVLEEVCLEPQVC